ncbi:MAG: hypothetical protein ABJZ55_07680 [Fuerstiella sp.]
MLKRIGSFASWLAALFVGIFFVSALTWNMAMAGSGVGTGVFSYWFRASFNLWPASDSADDLLVGSVTVEGDAGRRFTLWGHNSPRYHQVAIHWHLVLTQRTIEGQAVADLAEMQLHLDHKIQSLSIENLCTLFGVTGQPDNEIIADLYAFLESARDGALPPPSHHGHSFPDPLPGRMQHFASGPSIRPPELAWVVSWCGIGALALFKRTSKSASSSVPREA